MKTIEKLRGESIRPNPDRRFYILVFVAAFAIMVLRRPDAILNPQFWAEDGTLLYADAYNKGIAISLLSPQGGYLDTFPRLIAGFTQFFPLSWAPLLFNMSLMMIKGLLVCFILSTRFSHAVPALGLRLLLAFLYLVLPNSWEVNAGLTHAKIHLALFAFVVLSAKPDSNRFWRIFDAGIILISGLSGPFCIMLTPIAALFWFFRRDRRFLILFMLIGVCAVIQGTFLMTSTGRPQQLLGATPKLFIEILTGQVFLGALIGERGLHFIGHRALELMSRFSILYNLLMIIFGILGLVSLINTLLRAPLELRLFILYALMLFCAALSSPLGNLTDPQWPLMLIPGVGGRYWFIPMLAFVSVLVWSLRKSGSRTSRALAVLAFVMMMTGIVFDWRYPAFKDLNFREHAYRFESAPVGTQATIPINPDWSMVLTKHL